MAAKISKEDTDRRKSCRFVLTALTRQGPRVASLLDGFASPHRREDDPAPGFLATVLALARRLEAAIERLLTAGAALYNADAELVVLRTLRDTVTAKLAATIVRLRRKALADHVAPDLVGLALHSPRLYRADPLLRQIEMIDERFRRDDVEDFLGEAFDDEPVDLRPAIAKALEIADELRAVLELIDEGRRRHDEALIARDEARTYYDELFVSTARTFEGFCRMAGLKELARRVRPSTRRPGRIDLPDEEETHEAVAFSRAGWQGQAEAPVQMPSTVGARLELPYKAHLPLSSQQSHSDEREDSCAPRTMKSDRRPGSFLGERTRLDAAMIPIGGQPGDDDHEPKSPPYSDIGAPGDALRLAEGIEIDGQVPRFGKRAAAAESSP